jgi:two-component system sensor histidine kinase PilS (NtrC family)
MKKKQLKHLKDFSGALFLLFNKWIKNNKINGESFFLENSSIEMLAQFSLLQKKNSSDTIILLEDVSKLTQQAQQQKLASLGRLTASIAHEIRNPLAAICHAGELLSESEVIDVADKRLTEIIDQQSKRLNKIIDTVLNLSRRHQINIEKIKLTEWIKRFLEDQIHFPADQISLIVEDDYIISFDPQHLQQILANLIQNALRHSLVIDNSELDSRELDKAYLNNHKLIMPVTIKIYQEATIRIDILNYGEKITAEDEEHLFEPFFTTQTSGTGLGLYMAKELADSNFSRLNYIPLGSQTCFRLVFGSDNK